MSATFIPALVIKHNNDVYLTPDLQVGVVKSIPTPGSGAIVDGDYWAVPISDLGVVTGFNFIPTTPDSLDAPTEQSFHVFRLTNRFGNDVWYAVGTTTFDGDSPANPGYIQAAQDAECCDDTPRTLPMTTPALAPCQEMCQWDENDKYFAVFQLPTLTGNLRYYPYGYFNGTLLTLGTATGYANTTTLLAFLNSGAWATVGTWSLVGANTIRVEQAAGPGTDVLCAQIITVNPSA